MFLRDIKKLNQHDQNSDHQIASRDGDRPPRGR